MRKSRILSREDEEVEEVNVLNYTQRELHKRRPPSKAVSEMGLGRSEAKEEAVDGANHPSTEARTATKSTCRTMWSRATGRKSLASQRKKLRWLSKKWAIIARALEKNWAVSPHPNNCGSGSSSSSDNVRPSAPARSAASLTTSLSYRLSYLNLSFAPELISENV